MSSNQDKIIEKYKRGFEDRRAELSRAGKMEFHYTEKLLRRYMKGLPRTIELGCATGYYAYALADICGSYTGVDLSPENITIFEKKLSEKPLTTARGEPVKCRVGDATDLSDIPDGSYDAVLCLGPMYHLPPEERRKVFAECYRIASPGALLASAYICTTGLVAGASCFDGVRCTRMSALTTVCLTSGPTTSRPGCSTTPRRTKLRVRLRRRGLRLSQITGLISSSWRRL